MASTLKYIYFIQGLHRLKKYLNLEGFLEKSLKIKSALKNTGALKSPWILLFSVGLSTVDRDLDQYKIVVPLFGAALVHQIKAQQFYTNSLVLSSTLSQSSISEVEF